jgi:hypothetical protein
MYLHTLLKLEPLFFVGRPHTFAIHQDFLARSQFKVSTSVLSAIQISIVIYVQPDFWGVT